MTSPTSPSSIEERLYEANHALPRPEFLADLRARLPEEHVRPVSFREQFRIKFLRPAWVTVVVLILILVASMIAVGPERVLAAFRQFLGYIPGVGIFDTSAPIRVLAEPISVTQDGITITVTSATLTGDRTHIEYRIFGVPASAYPGREDVMGCAEPEYLRLPDGTQLDDKGRDFPPIPFEVDEAVFVIPCISNTLPGKVPGHWELPLRFAAAPPDLTIVPVIESLPSQAPSAAANTTTSAPDSRASVTNPLTITRVLDIGDRFVLMGELSYDAAQDASLPAGSWWVTRRISILGADGREVPQTSSNDLELPTPTRPNSEAWLYQLEKNFVPPVTISYAGEIISPVGPREQAEFAFDAGLSPENGRVWTLNRDFSLGGYNIRLVSIESSARGYSFLFDGDPGASANAIHVDIVGYAPNCGGGGGGDDFPQIFSVNVCYAGFSGAPEFPHGKLSVVVHFQALARQNKSFQVQWSPDTTQTGPFVTSTPQPGVCLDSASLAQLDPAPPTLFNGKALFYENLDGADQWGLALYNLDNPQRQVSVPGHSWGALSPDGSQLAYPAEDGIHVMDLDTRTERVLAGVNGFALHWSPDGKQIANVGGSISGVFVASTDGASVRQVSDRDYGAVVGWSPDGARLYFVVPYTGGAAWKLYALDLMSGAAQELHTIENGTPKALNASLSPDGEWIAYRGRDNSSLYLVHPDGTGMHMVLDNVGAVGVAWSTSGWLGVSLLEANTDNRTLVLVKPNGCEAYLLPDLHGDLEGLSIP